MLEVNLNMQLGHCPWCPVDWFGGVVGKRKEMGKDGLSLVNQVVGLSVLALTGVPVCPRT